MAAQLTLDHCGAREEIEATPTNETVEAHTRATAAFTQEKIQATRKSWHEKTASLNMEKDMQELWNIPRNLNKDNPGRSKTVLEVDQVLYTERRAANLFTDLYQKENSVHMSRWFPMCG